MLKKVINISKIYTWETSKNSLEVKKNHEILIKDDKTPQTELKQKIVNHIYEMAKLSIGGLDQKQIVNLQLNNAELITELINSYK